MNVYFRCPECQAPDRQQVGEVAAPWQCHNCGQRVELQPAPWPTAPLGCCVCSNAELYKQKDFPHWLGLAILASACIAFLGLKAIYHQWWAWVILIGSAVFDGLLYLWVGDVVVCYQCGAHFRGAPPAAEHKPHEQAVAERYRQERLRREQLKNTARGGK